MPLQVVQSTGDALVAVAVEGMEYLLSHSNSFGFEMEKDAAGCRALNRNYYCRRWCADANQKTQTDSDAGGGIWQNRLTPKR